MCLNIYYKPLTVHLACGYDDSALTRTYECPDAGSCLFLGSVNEDLGIYHCNAAVSDDIVTAEFSSDGSSAPSCTVGLEGRYRFETFFESPRKHRVTLFPGQDIVRFSVPRLSGLFDSGKVPEGDLRKVCCSIRGAVEGVNSPLSEEDTSLPEYGDTFVDEDMLTATVTVSEHGSDDDTKTLHGYMSSMLFGVNADERIERMGSALYYTYFLGWYTGFIRMPYFSIQDLLSALPYTVPDPDGKGRSDNASALQALNNNENLRRYQLLASLFVDESDGRFPIEHFGFLTPDEAKERYKSEYSARFDAYFGRALGVFLQELPPRYRQQ